MKIFTNSRKGFTLIELLVVIGILGVLAAALIATIDPFEQIRKAQDTNVKDIAVQYVDANVRYYTTHNLLPWGFTASCNGQSAPGGITLGAAGMAGCLTSLVYDGELKPAFTGVTAALSSIVITGTSDSVTACFQPVSKAQLSDPNTKYTQNGSINASCPSQTAGCYWCTY